MFPRRFNRSQYILNQAHVEGKKERECKGERKKGKEEIKVKEREKWRKKRGEWVNGEGREERGKEGIEKEKKQFKKIPLLETKCLHNTLKHKRELIFERDINRRHTMLSPDVITQEVCLISCINGGAP